MPSPTEPYTANCETSSQVRSLEVSQSMISHRIVAAASLIVSSRNRMGPGGWSAPAVVRRAGVCLHETSMRDSLASAGNLATIPRSSVELKTSRPNIVSEVTWASCGSARKKLSRGVHGTGRP